MTLEQIGWEEEGLVLFLCGNLNMFKRDVQWGMFMSMNL